MNNRQGGKSKYRREHCGGVVSFMAMFDEKIVQDDNSKYKLPNCELTFLSATFSLLGDHEGE